MMSFSFTAPTLLEPDAIPSASAGLPTKKGVNLDASAWVFEVASNEGFVMSFVSNLDGDGARITLLVTEMRGAAEGVDRTVEALLNRSSEIAELKVIQ
jgi:hypothetical protein